MKRTFLTLLSATILVLFAFATAAMADSGDNVVGAAYTITNNASANQVAIYNRAADGTLSSAGAVDTGGRGTGAGLASQGAVTLTDNGRTLLAVNPGSNTVSALAVERGGLRLLGSAPSGGIRPVSVAVRGDLVYVLNKNNAALATVSALRLTDDGITSIPGSTRTLNAGATDAAQVAISPDGSTLVVTGRSSQRIDTFRLGPDGLASDLKSFPVAPASTPFGFDFDNKGHLLVSLAGVGASSGAASYALSGDGDISTISAPIATGQRAACWLVASKDGRYAFVANAASASVSTFAVAPDGSLEFRSAVTVDGMTPLDEALSVDGRTLYVLAAGSHGIVAFDVASDGSLTHIGTQPGVAATAAGLAVR